MLSKQYLGLYTQILNRIPELSRFENCYGERHARLSLDQAVFHCPKRRQWFPLRVLAALFLWMPDQYTARLQKIWVDNTLVEARWSEFLADMQREWERTITPVGVLGNSPF